MCFTLRAFLFASLCSLLLWVCLWELFAGAGCKWLLGLCFDFYGTFVWVLQPGKVVLVNRATDQCLWAMKYILVIHQGNTLHFTLHTLQTQQSEPNVFALPSLFFSRGLHQHCVYFPLRVYPLTGPTQTWEELPS